MNEQFTFQPLPRPVEWTGRYNRIPGKEPAFKARVDGSILAYWRPWPGDEWLTSMMFDCLAARQMASAVNDTKAMNAGAPGGTFQINEFGQVLCPVGSLAKRYWVGTVGGVPKFNDPRDTSKPFVLQEATTTPAGVRWDRPYIGMKFNLDGNDSIYFEHDDNDTRTRIRLRQTDGNLALRLRQVRSGAANIRFIVNLHGVVLTKIEPDWNPVFIGHINPRQWFPQST